MSIAWERFKDIWPPLVGAGAVILVVSAVAGQVPNVFSMARPGVSRLAVTPLGLSWGVVQWALTTFLDVGFTRMLLAAARGNTPAFGMLFSGGDRFLAALGCGLLRSFAVGVGFVLLIVPGIILALGFAFATFFVVDANLGPIEALQASWQATRGQKAELFVLSVLTCLVYIAGLAMCCVGLAAAFPLCMLAFAVAFTRVTGRSPLDAPGEPSFASPSL